tara:strand:- start:22222 stop:22455 length:234 start_codon:yes stop_codon:yes gene_type:complete
MSGKNSKKIDMKKETLTRKNVVILISEDHTKMECWGSLKLACVAHPELVYNTLTKYSLPLVAKGWAISRVPFNKSKN